MLIIIRMFVHLFLLYVLLLLLLFVLSCVLIRCILLLLLWCVSLLGFCILCVLLLFLLFLSWFVFGILCALFLACAALFFDLSYDSLSYYYSCIILLILRSCTYSYHGPGPSTSHAPHNNHHPTYHYYYFVFCRMCDVVVGLLYACLFCIMCHI